MSAETDNGPELTKEQLELNRKRFLFNNQMITVDPDLENPDLAKSLTEAINAHNKTKEPVVEKTPEELAAEAQAKEAADKAAKEAADKEAADKAAADKDAADKAAAEKKDTETDPETKEEETDAAATALTADIDPLEIAERAAARAVELAQKPAAPTPPAAPDFESTLPRTHRNDLAAIRHLEAANPTLAGTSAKVLDFYKREDAYIKQWEASHPGQAFDADAEEHSNLYARMPQVDPEALEVAREELREKQIEERLEKKIAAKREPELREAKFREEVEKAQPVAHNRSSEAVVEMLKQASPELYKALEVDGKPIISEATINKMAETDPVAFEVANENAEKLRIMVGELHKMANVQGYVPNPSAPVVLRSTDEKFFPHAELQAYAAKLEQELASLPQSQTAKGTKRFITQAELVRRHESILKSDLAPERKNAAIRELDNRFWALDDKRIERALVTTFAEKTKKRIEKFTANLDRKPASAAAVAAGAAPGGEKKVNGETGKDTPPEQKTSTARKSPVTTTASDKIDTSKTATPPEGLTKEKIMKTMWG